ncbi:alpha-L-fucosidase [Maribacter vaceletii]|uniref:alpha-L-fucosidase n=1 Tax=Maribacter vaceletii TaxID=1206816 RepID=A0A495DTK7_9FLAO|nr:alpha-L-fucosidase [Maribacter vaceletii]RKR07985.1 alpha-L-fucosidase [Maribacter vaceletii]
MKKYFLLFLLIVPVKRAICQQNQGSSDVTSSGEPRFKANWESLAQVNNQPEWFEDAKLGIYFHWGPYSVPAYKSEWYPRWMYIKDAKDWAPDTYAFNKYGSQDRVKGIYEYHKENFGDPSEFNYHDFIPMFKAEKFDAADWVDLFEKAGAKFLGPVAQHHDGFAMWDSEVNMWNSMDKGPKKDILGEIFKEAKKRDIKTLATFHHSKNRQLYADDSKAWGGWDSHFPYHPDYATSSIDPELKYLYGNIPVDEFNKYWLDQVNEVVDKYGPDIIWFDVWLDRVPEKYRQEMVAHHFNKGIERSQEPIVVYKQQDIPSNVGVMDMEQAGRSEMSQVVWMTDITISLKSWSYIQNQPYKKADLLLKNMIDVWSKKGVVLLNVSPMADGTINQQQRDVLAEMGAWLNTYGEAVYGTRTHTIHGYGISEIKAGFEGVGQSATQEFNANDIRFTRSKDGKTLYVFMLGMPEANTTIELEEILPNVTNKIKNVSLIGSDVAIEWELNGVHFKLKTPEEKEMNKIATVFKVEFE